MQGMSGASGMKKPRKPRSPKSSFQRFAKRSFSMPNIKSIPNLLGKTKMGAM